MNELQIRLVKFSEKLFLTLEPYMSIKFLDNAIGQVIRSSTSVGANYSEAQSSSSYRDFYNKVKVAHKELKETEYWLEYLSRIKKGNTELQALHSESVELLRIFAVISKKTNLKLMQMKSIRNR